MCQCEQKVKAEQIFGAEQVSSPANALQMGLENSGRECNFNFDKVRVVVVMIVTQKNDGMCSVTRVTVATR